jgi:hypothetical protein
MSGWRKGLHGDGYGDSEEVFAGKGQADLIYWVELVEYLDEDFDREEEEEGGGGED